MIHRAFEDNIPVLLSFPAARERMFAALATLPAERIPLDAARGRTLAASVYAKADLVPYPRSAMDGFAVCACDVARAPVTLEVVKSVYAKPGEDAHTPGTATAIATGAPLPHGANAVIPVECVEVRGATITVTLPVEIDDNVFPPAQDGRRGDQLLAFGERLRPGALGLLATAGYARVDVTRRPRVAVVCTGDELVETHVQPLHGQVRNSNGIMLAAIAADCDAEVIVHCTVRDDLDALASTFDRVLPDVDALVVSGGASLGPRDFVKAALSRLDARWLFTSVAIRPGRPAGIALVNGTPVFVLPGNPAAAFVAASILLQPALRRMTGRRTLMATPLQARLGRDVCAKPNRTSFIFGRLEYSDMLTVVPLDNQCSSLIRTAADADAFIVAEPGEYRILAGEMATVWPLDSNSL